ncbi:hypothetical protein GPROT1_03851 [Gammaproteobacteria bacterium]|jgi:hypothetical protein|nr:hypothetical protein GPROT1_03851 [Gammaproteobacteria bacterium]
MHTLTVSIQGAANDSTSVELPDDQALPVYVKLKEIVAGTRVRRAARKESGVGATDGLPDAGKNGTADPSTDVDR